MEKLTQEAPTQIKFIDLGIILGTTARGAASIVAAAFRENKKNGNHYMCDLIARCFVNRFGKKAW